MVRLKDLADFPLVYEYLSFNSNMVRLKVFLNRYTPLVQSSFNSNMVRLKGFDVGRCSASSEVSIPIWYD